MCCAFRRNLMTCSVCSWRRLRRDFAGPERDYLQPSLSLGIWQQRGLHVDYSRRTWRHHCLGFHGFSAGGWIWRSGSCWNRGIFALVGHYWLYLVVVCTSCRTRWRFVCTDPNLMGCSEWTVCAWMRVNPGCSPGCILFAWWTLHWLLSTLNHIVCNEIS